MHNFSCDLGTDKTIITRWPSSRVQVWVQARPQQVIRQSITKPVPAVNCKKKMACLLRPLSCVAWANQAGKQCQAWSQSVSKMVVVTAGLCPDVISSPLEVLPHLQCDTSSLPAVIENQRGQCLWTWNFDRFWKLCWLIGAMFDYLLVWVMVSEQNQGIWTNLYVQNSCRSLIMTSYLSRTERLLRFTWNSNLKSTAFPNCSEQRLVNDLRLWHQFLLIKAKFAAPKITNEWPCQYAM